MNEAKPMGLDGEGTEILKEAVLNLLNQFPGLEGRAITFSGLSADSGISLEPESGTLIYSERKDILGNVTQECQFPFFVIYRTGATSEYLKMNVNEFLDSLGAWICREPVTVNGVSYRLVGYPALAGNREITGVVRFNSYALEPNQNNTQDWVLPVTVKFTHRFMTW